MAYNAAFSISESSNPSLVVINDTSTGSDPNITSKTLTLYNADGSVYTTADWPVGDSSITLDILPRDVSLNISLSVASSDPEPDPSTYTYSQIHAFVRYEKNYGYYLTQLQTANPSISQDQNFYNGKLRLLCEILSAEDAISIGEDAFAAQMCIERGNYLITNPLNYF
jgi:hypothetical protein